MSGPGGATTKRDQRRLARQEQFRRQQAARQRERQRQLRNQQIRRYSLIGGAAIVVIVAIVLISVFAFHVGGGNSGKGGHTSALATFPPVSGAAADGKQIDGMQCATTQGSAQHQAAELDIYINGQRMTVPPGVGAPGTCFYPLRVKSGAANAIQVLSPSATQSYTLGEFFDVWGQPLSVSQVGGYTANAQHKLVFEVFDPSGKLSTVTSDPRQIALVNHETIVILYNSPNVHPTAYTNWAAIGD